MERRQVISLVLVAAVSACARAYPPPGGEQDRTPPRLADATPAPLSVVSDYGEPAVFRFDERLSERGFSEALVIVSPLDGALRVDRKRNEVRVRIEGGWRPNRVYRVIVLPGLRDLFGNARTESVELVFSTGPPVPNTAIAGLVTDRVSERAARDAIVTAVRRADSVSYMAVADTAGFFSLRHLPMGVYDLRAFTDQNRNRRRDPSEPVDSGRFVSLGSAADTITAMFSVLAPDSTAPRLTAAESIDSLHVRLTFDDFVAPQDSSPDVRGQVLQLPDSTSYARVAQTLHPTTLERARRAIADTTTGRVPGDTTARRVPGDTTARRIPADPAARRTPAAPAPATLVPNRSLIVRLDRPLQAGAEYVVTMENVVNLHGLAGGGAVSFKTREAAPGGAPARPDTLFFPLR